MESKRNLDTTSYSLEYMGDKPREASAPYDMHCSMLERILGRSQIIELLNSDEFMIFCLQSVGGKKFVKPITKCHIKI